MMCPSCGAETPLDFEATAGDATFTCGACGFSKPYGPKFAQLKSTLPHFLNARELLARQNAPGSQVARKAAKEAEEARDRWLRLLEAWVREWAPPPS